MLASLAGMGICGHWIFLKKKVPLKYSFLLKNNSMENDCQKIIIPFPGAMKGIAYNGSSIKNKKWEHLWSSKMRSSFCLASLPSCQNSSSLACLLYTPEVREFVVDGTNICATDLLFTAFFPDQDFSSNSNLKEQNNYLGSTLIGKFSSILTLKKANGKSLATKNYPCLDMLREFGHALRPPS